MLKSWLSHRATFLNWIWTKTEPMKWTYARVAVDFQERALPRLLWEENSKNEFQFRSPQLWKRSKNRKKFWTMTWVLYLVFIIFLWQTNSRSHLTWTICYHRLESLGSIKDCWSLGYVFLRVFPVDSVHSISFSCQTVQMITGVKFQNWMAFRSLRGWTFQFQRLR